MPKTRIDLKEAAIYLFKHELKNIQTTEEGNISVKFYVNYLKYKKSKESLKQCLLEKKNYEIDCYIPIEVNLRQKNIIKCEIIKKSKQNQ